MKKHLLSLLVLFVTASAVPAQTATTQTPENQIINGKREGFWKITAALKHLSSPWTPQQVVEQGNYAASMKTGIWTEFFVSGKTKSELTYVNNRANGPAKIYFENGKIQEEGIWVGNRWTGDYKLYYDNGNLRQQFKYNSLGVRDGEQVYYHPNGQVSKRVTIKNGKEEGWEKDYNTNGDLVEEKFYNGGTIDPAKTKTYDPVKPEVKDADKTPEEIANEKKKAPTVGAGSGQVSKEGVFDGEGYWILNSGGHVTFKGTFQNYKLMDGEERIYDKNGMCIMVKLYADGKYTGNGPIPKEESGK